MWGGRKGDMGVREVGAEREEKEERKTEKILPCTSATFWAAGKENKSSDPGCFASGVKTGAGAWVRRVGGSAGRGMGVCGVANWPTLGKLAFLAS